MTGPSNRVPEDYICVVCGDEALPCLYPMCERCAVVVWPDVRYPDLNNATVTDGRQ